MTVKAILIGGALSVAAILAAMAQNPVAKQTTTTAKTAPRIVDGGAIVAELAKSINAKKTKADDKIEGRLTMDLLSHGEIAIPRGAKIVGHIVEARARTKEMPESLVKIAFDRLILKNGQEIPLKATIQAVGAPMQTSVPESSDADFAEQAESRPAPGPNEMRHNLTTTFPGSRRPAGATTGGGDAGRVDAHRNGPSLGPFSQGVIGIKGIALSNAAQGSAISSTSKNVHLSSGTQLVLHITERQALNDPLLKTKN